MKFEVNIKIGMIVFVLLICLISSVSAAYVGVSPANINFKGVLRGGYSEKSAIISVDSDRSVAISVSPNGEIANWINVSSTKFIVSKNAPYYLKISIRPPSGTPNGNYTGFLRISPESLASSKEGYATATIRAAVELSLSVEVTDTEYKSCSASAFEMISAEKGDDIILSMDIENTGNILMNPRVSVDIWDENQISIIKRAEFSDEQIIPTTSKNIKMKINSDDLEIGQYWADVSAVDCYSLQSLTFDVLELGALKESGLLLGISARPFAEIGQTVPLTVNFKNVGEKEVEAWFDGKATYGDKIVQLFKSERALVPISETTNFSFYFTPTHYGKYIISGRVFYGKKRTFESSVVINVNSKNDFQRIITFAIYAIIIIAVVTLLYKIRKERKVYSAELRELRRKR
jgi:hypothetical protein